MLNWLKRLMGFESDNGQMPIVEIAVADAPAPERHSNPTQADMDNLISEALAVEAEQELDAAMQKHEETVSGHDPELKAIARKLREMD